MKKIYCPFLLFSTSLIFLLLISVTPILAAEEKNIDSFNVHPANRYTETNEGMAVTVDNGRLKVTDTGDGSVDYYTIERDIRDLSGTVEIRFLLEHNTASPDSNDRMFFMLRGDATANSMYFDVRSIGTSGSDSKLVYYDTGAGTETLDFPSSEDLQVDTWYRLRIDYDVLESSIRWRCYYQNDSKVFDYDWFDVGSDFPEFFTNTELQIVIKTSHKTNTKILTSYIDYITAPFKERTWVQTDIPTDPQYLLDSVYAAQVEDNVAELKN